MLVHAVAVITATLATAPAYAGLTIQPIYDASITSLPGAAAVQNTINAALAVYSSAFANNETFPVTFKYNAGIGGATSLKLVYTTSFAGYRAKLALTPQSPNDTIALAAIGAGPTDPVIGGLSIKVPEALMKGLGLILAPQGSDYGTVTLGSGFDLNPAGLLGVVQHEVNELLGTSSSLPNGSGGVAGAIPTVIATGDLFRYDTQGVGGARLFDVNAANNPAAKAWFKLSASSSALEGFHNLPNGGDYGDYAALGDFPAAPQDWTGNPSVFTGMAGSSNGGNTGTSTSELVLLDVVGWNAAVTPVPEASGLVALLPFGIGVAAYWRRQRRTA